MPTTLTNNEIVNILRARFFRMSDRQQSDIRDIADLDNDSDMEFADEEEYAYSPFPTETMYDKMKIEHLQKVWGKYDYWQLQSALPE